MSHVKIGARYGTPPSSATIATRAAPVAVPDRGIAVASGFHSHGEYVIQVRPTPAPAQQAARVSWADEERDVELELEPARLHVER